MINHARTLLLNRDGNKRPPSDYYLEEYVDPSFRAIVLPGWLANLHDILVPDGSDNAFANFRLWQYMKLLHSNEYEAYVYALDRRVTYQYDHGFTIIKGSSIYTPMNTEAQGIVVYFSGEPAQNAATPRLARSWNVKVLSPTLVRTESLQDGTVNETVVTFDMGITSLIPLAGQTGFFIRIAMDPLPIDSWWIVESFVKPQADLNDLLEPLERFAGSHPNLFLPREEPYVTFGQLWNKEAVPAIRMSGLLLAFIYQVEKVRTNG